MRSKFLLVSALIVLIPYANARIPGRGGVAVGNDGYVGSVDLNNPSVGEPGTMISAGSGTNCSPKDTNKYVNRNFLEAIADPSVPSSQIIQVEKVENGAYEVKIPKHLSACTKLEVEVTRARNNYFIRVKNNYDFKREDISLEAGENFDNLSFSEKHFRCLDKKGLLDENGRIDRAKAESMGEVSYGRTFNPFAVDIGNASESVSVYFGSATAYYGEPSNVASNVSPKPTGWNCVTYENIGSGRSRLFTSVKDQVYDRALRVCQTESAEQIYEELSRLRDSTAGNYRDIERILEQAFEKAQESRVEEIYDRMTEIEDAMKPGEDGELISESLAQEYAKEYSALAKEISKIVIQPSTQKVVDLLKIRTSSNADEIDKKVKELNEKVQRFSKRNFDKLGFVYDVMKEYALTDEARDIEGLRLASHFYGRIYKGKEHGRGKSMSLDDASDKVENLITSFEDNTLKDWQANYATKRGSKAPIRATVREIRETRSRMDRDYQRFQRREQENTRKYCSANMIGSMRNPTRCRSWMAGKDRRMRSVLNRRSRDLSFLRTRTDQYSTYMTNFEDFQMRQSELRNSSDPFQFYGSTNFNNNYDIYGNPNDFSNDFGWQYSMQGPAQSPMMPMMGPQMRGPASTPFSQPMMPQQGFMQQGNPFATPFQ